MVDLNFVKMNDFFIFCQKLFQANGQEIFTGFGRFSQGGCC
jgi:hypothetical protein